MQCNSPVAVIDVGSNSIKLLVAGLKSHSETIETLLVETIETRISNGISLEKPKLTKDAIKQGVATISELLSLAQKFNPVQIEIVATSAVRDASNSDQFKTSVAKETGIPIRVLLGSEEATYIGQGISCDPAIQGLENFLQVDLGGGSLELVCFHKGTITSAISLQLGAVRLAEKFIKDRSSPLSPKTQTKIHEYVIQTLRKSSFNSHSESVPLIATGGAFSVLRAILATQKGDTVEDSSPQITQAEIIELKNTLTELTLTERLKIPDLPEKRADIIPTALITICALLEATGHQSFTHSFYNLKYGIAKSLLLAKVKAENHNIS